MTLSTNSFVRTCIHLKRIDTYELTTLYPWKLSHLSSTEELSDDLQVLLPLLPERCVAGVFEGDPLRVRNLLAISASHIVLRYVVSPVDDERGDVDFVETFLDRPSTQDPMVPT